MSSRSPMFYSSGLTAYMWVVVKIMVPLWVASIIGAVL